MMGSRGQAFPYRGIAVVRNDDGLWQFTLPYPGRGIVTQAVPTSDLARLAIDQWSQLSEQAKRDRERLARRSAAVQASIDNRLMAQPVWVEQQATGCRDVAILLIVGWVIIIASMLSYWIYGG